MIRVSVRELSAVEKILPAQLWPLRHHLLLGKTVNHWALLLLPLLPVHFWVVFIVQDDHCRCGVVWSVVWCGLWCALSYGQVWTELWGERCCCICILTAINSTSPSPRKLRVVRWVSSFIVSVFSSVLRVFARIERGQIEERQIDRPIFISKLWWLWQEESYLHLVVN